ncbi:RNA 2'-phosphotransferase [[Pseudopropionibacterium] massiliense]|mgnify:CR=1 FL=1|uniref:RNA 2'-phosphotransferase n=1 Tax=[Pseudopropionibacterium] massiliense TaxID=2220000 RepID=UPI001030767F|nr:RNA 2'-phosphotransferase [[Pseudopropionibacterium] massiliense]
MKKRSTDLSRVLSHALRHDPGHYGLELDPGGWVDLGEVVAALRSRPGWESVGVSDIEETLASASKQRHEIRDGRIRAIYGHSLPERIERTPATPPALLYHGTSPDSLDRVMREGLLPMSRQFVHLSTDVEMARSVGARHAPRPVVLHIDAAAAHAAGIPFYRGNDKVWLADEVPPRFVTDRTPTS